jgi:cell division protein FtsN
MKSVKVIILALSVMLLATGCDFIRSSLGKPTSKDLAIARESLAKASQAVNLAEKATADSVAAAAKADSVAKASSAPGKALDKAYYIAGGSFTVKENAGKMAAKFRADGLNPVVTRFKNGYYVVFTEGFDTKEAAQEALKREPYSGYGPNVVALYRRTQDLVIESI